MTVFSNTTPIIALSRIQCLPLLPQLFGEIHLVAEVITIGQRPADYGLDSGTKVKDEIARALADAQDDWRVIQRKLDTLKSNSPAITETLKLRMVSLLGLLGYQLDYQPKAAELNGKPTPFSIASSISPD